MKSREIVRFTQNLIVCFIFALATISTGCGLGEKLTDAMAASESGAGGGSSNASFLASLFSSNEPGTYTVGGRVVGLKGSELVLTLNGGSPIEITEDGNFAFPTAIKAPAAYRVAVSMQPVGPDQNCIPAARGEGSVTSFDITTVVIVCEPKKTAYYLPNPFRIAASPDRSSFAVVSPNKKEIKIMNLYGTFTHVIRVKYRPMAAGISSAGDVYVSDAVGKKIWVYDNRGKFVRTFGSGINAPLDLAISDSLGRVYVVHSDQNQIDVYNLQGAFQFSFGTAGTGDGQFKFPYCVAVNEAAQEVAVCDQANNRVQIFTTDGTFKSNIVLQKFTHRVQESAIPTAFDGVYASAQPRGIGVGPNGNYYIVDSLRGSVLVYSSNLILLGKLGIRGRDPGELMIPSDAAVTSDGRLFVANTLNNRIEIFEGL